MGRMNEDELAQALGGKVGGHVEDGAWSCVDCDASGTEADDQTAALVLHHHRQHDHGRI